MIAPVFDGVNLVVGDMDASVAFYRRLGVDIPDRGPWDADHRTAETPDGLGLRPRPRESFAPQWNSGLPGAPGPRRGGASASRSRPASAVDRDPRGPHRRGLLVAAGAVRRVLGLALRDRRGPRRQRGRDHEPDGRRVPQRAPHEG